MMACNISKHSNGTANFSGSSAKSVFASGFSTFGFSGSGSFVNTCAAEYSNAATESSPILKSDISEQL